MYIHVNPEDLHIPTCVECDPTNTFKKYFERNKHDSLLQLLDSYEKLVDRLEEQIEVLTKEVAELKNEALS